MVSSLDCIAPVHWITLKSSVTTATTNNFFSREKKTLLIGINVKKVWLQ